MLLLSVQEVRERRNLLHAACLVFVHGVCILYTYILHTYIRIYIHVVCVCAHKYIYTAHGVLCSVCGLVEDQLSWRKSEFVYTSTA